MESFIQNNLLYVFLGVTVFSLVILFAVKINSVKKRKELECNTNLVKVTFNEAANLARPIDTGGVPGFTIYTVNNNKPSFVDHTLFLNPGKNIIAIGFCHLNVGLTSNTYTTYEKTNIEIDTKLGFSYEISFNLMEKKYDISETKK